MNNTDLVASQVDNSGPDLVITLGNIPANTGWTVKYQVNITNNTAIGNAINRATVKSGTATSGESQAQVTINPQTEPLVLSKQANVENVKIGDTVSFNLTITNNNVKTINNIKVDDTLPQGFSIQRNHPGM